MLIRVGYEIVLECPAPTVVVAKLSVHPSRRAAIRRGGRLIVEPRLGIHEFHDEFGNCSARLRVPAGRTRLHSDTLVRDSGEPEPQEPAATQHDLCDLPQAALQFLLPSRYCEVDRIGNLAWRLFGSSPAGWARVQAICDYVHRHVRFDYSQARATRSAFETHEEQVGVCRDFAHLAIAFCRCLNIPARYCAGYLGNIGVPPPPLPMDFSAWFEAYLGGRWYAFDPRHNVPRIGRVLMARGRDAVDVALLTTFGLGMPVLFEVWAEAVNEAALEAAS